MSVHEEWLKNIQKYQEDLKAQGVRIQLPPPTLKELGIEYLEINPGVKMQARLPFQDRFTNPIGLYQGGLLGAALDEVFGPLAYISAGRPCVTLSMNLTFLRPFTKSMENCFIEARVLQMTKNLIFMKAEIQDTEKNLLVHAETHVSIMRDDQLAKVKA